MYKSKKNNGHESIPTDGYDATLDIPYTKSSIESCIHRNDVSRSAPAYGNNATSSSSGQTSGDECQEDLEHDNNCAVDIGYLTLLWPSVLPKNSLQTKRRPSQLEASAFHMIQCERDKITEVKCNLSSALRQRLCSLALQCRGHSKRKRLIE